MHFEDEIYAITLIQATVLIGYYVKLQKGPLKNSSIFKQSMHFNTSLSWFIFQGCAVCLFVSWVWIHEPVY